MTDDVVRLQRHREIGVEILNELMHATADTWEKAVERQLAWEKELIPLVEPLGPQAARFKPLTPMRPEEQLNAMRVRPLSHAHRMALVEQDVMLYRLNELFAGFPPTQPKRPGRKRGVKLYDDRAAIAEARRLLAEPNPPSRHKAAWEVEYLADRGASPEANFARVYKALRGV